MQKYNYHVTQIDTSLDKHAPITDAWICAIKASQEIFVQYNEAWECLAVPGAFCKPGETPEETAIRGFEELTGAKASLDNLLAHVYYQVPHEGQTMSGCAAFFVSIKWDGELKNGNWFQGLDNDKLSNVLRPVLYGMRLGRIPMSCKIELSLNPE